MAKNKIRLNICGFECALCSDESETYIRSIGDEVQQAMNDMIDKNQRLSVTMAAIIAALNYCDDSHHTAETADNLRSQIKNYLEDASHARLGAEESQRELERVKRENQTLRARLAAVGEPPEKKPEDLPAAKTPPQQQTGSFSTINSEAEADPDSFIRFFKKNSNDQ